MTRMTLPRAAHAHHGTPDDTDMRLLGSAKR